MRTRGESVAALYASEGAIYGRFGFGVATYESHLRVARHRNAFRSPVSTAGLRLVPLAEAVPAIDLPDPARSSPGTASSSRIAAITGVSPALIDTTSEVGVPSAAAAVEGRFVAYAAARDLARAAELAVEGAIAHRQVGRFDRAEPEVRFEAAAGRETNRAIAARLAENGWRSVAIPMDQDRAVAAACPYLVTVALLPLARAAA
jgi:hypothetical protein